MRFRIKTPVAGDYQEVMEGFNRDLFERLTPPGVKVALQRFDGSKKGDIVHLRLFLAGFIQQDWISEITEDGIDEEKAWFVDRGTQLPFFLKKWQHRHIVENQSNHAVIVDDIEFRSPFWLTDPLLYPVLWLQFAWRKPVYQRIFGKVKST